MGLKRALLAAAVGLASASGANAAWYEASSKHFVVYSDDAPDKLKTFTAKLERYDRAMRVMRGLDDPAISPTQRVTVYVLDDVGDIARLFGRGGSGVAGFYNARASGPVAFIPRHGDGGGQYALSPQAILLHEYAHHLMFSSYGATVFPPWYVEGFAEYNATASFAPDGSVTFGAVPMYRLWGIAGVAPMSARQLLVADPGHLSPEQRETMYGRGWLLTHYLMADARRRQQLGDYIGALNAGKSPADAADTLDVKTLDRRLEAYTHQKLSGFTVPAAKLTIGDVALRPLAPGEAAVMPARILSTRGIDAKTAPRVVALARKLAAPFPVDSAAQNELAEAELDAGNPDASLAAADRALAADPHSMHAMVYRGLAQQAMAAKGGATDPARWQAVRRSFIVANHADPDAPYPMELNYVSYIAAGQKPTRNAEDGLLTAASFAPYDADLELMAAFVLLGRNKPEEAKAMLKPVAYNPHGGAVAAVATQVLAKLDAGDKAGALALISPKQDSADKSAASAN